MADVTCARCSLPVDVSAAHEIVGLGKVCAGCCDCAGFDPSKWWPDHPGFRKREAEADADIDVSQWFDITDRVRTVEPGPGVWISRPVRFDRDALHPETVLRGHSIGNVYAWEGPDDRDSERSFLVGVGCDGDGDSFHGSVRGEGNVFGGEVECPGCGRLLVFDMAGTDTVNVREVTA